MVNGLQPLPFVNRNRFQEEPLSCAKDASRAVDEAKRRLALVFTAVGTAEAIVPSLWLAQRVKRALLNKRGA